MSICSASSLEMAAVGAVSCLANPDRARAADMGLIWSDILSAAAGADRRDPPARFLPLVESAAAAGGVAWQELVVGFDHWPDAMTALQDLPATALLLDALALLEAPVAQRMPWSGGCPAPAASEHRLLLLAAPDSLEVLPTWLAARGGSVRWQQSQGQGQSQGQRPSRGLPLRELCWNHTTLHWRSHHPDWTYLQLQLPDPATPLIDALRRRWGDGLLWHLEAVRQGGAVRLAGLPLLRFQGPEALRELIQHCRDLGALVFDPHEISVEDGGLGGIDPAQVAAKQRHDPGGLLNPGKLRGWLER